MGSMHNKACHNMTNTHRTLIKTLLDFNTVICDHNKPCTIVPKQYKPYTLRIICLIYLIFFCEILCPEKKQNYLFIFLFFFALRKKHPGIKYLAKYWSLHGSPNPRLGLEVVLGSKIESNDVAKGSHEQKFADLVQPKQHGWHGRTSSLQRFRVRLRVMVWL